MRRRGTRWDDTDMAIWFLDKEIIGNLSENIFSRGLMAEARLQRVEQWVSGSGKRVKASILNGLFKNLGFKQNVVNREEGGSKRVIRIWSSHLEMLTREKYKDFQVALKAPLICTVRIRISRTMPHLAIRKVMPGRDLHSITGKWQRWNSNYISLSTFYQMFIVPCSALLFINVCIVMSITDEY